MSRSVEIIAFVALLLLWSSSSRRYTEGREFKPYTEAGSNYDWLDHKDDLPEIACYVLDSRMFFMFNGIKQRDLIGEMITGESHPCFPDSGCTTAKGLGYRLNFKYALSAFHRSYYHLGNMISMPECVVGMAFLWCCDTNNKYIGQEIMLNAADFQGSLDLDLCSFKPEYNGRRAVDLLQEKKRGNKYEAIYRIYVAGAYDYIHNKGYNLETNPCWVEGPLNFKNLTADICSEEKRPVKPPPTPPPGGNETLPPTTPRLRASTTPPPTRKPPEQILAERQAAAASANNTNTALTTYLFPAMVIIIILAVAAFFAQNARKKRRLRRKRRPKKSTKKRRRGGKKKRRRRR